MTTKRKLPWKVVFFLPLILLPLAAALFYGMGGGSEKEGTEKVTSGLNTTLPGSLPQDASPIDKFSIYQLAEADSLRKLREQSSDPVYGIDTAGIAPVKEFPWQEPAGPASTARYTSPHAIDPHEQRVQEKLKELERELNRPAPPPPQYPPVVTEYTDERGSSSGALPGENLRSDPDPELAQINEVLEKVLDVQYPERVTQRLQEASVQQKSRVFPVTMQQETSVADLMSSPKANDSLIYKSPAHVQAQNGFFEWSASSPTMQTNNAVRAVIHETKTVVSGATIKLRLQQDIFLQGVRIPAGHFVFGKGNLAGDRYTISIRDIRFDGAVFPVGLEVVGMDGIPGIFIEGAIGREVLRDGASQGVQGLQLGTMDPSLRAQAAAATVETAKTLLNRKMRLTTVTLKAGEPVLLRDSNQQ